MQAARDCLESIVEGKKREEAGVVDAAKRQRQEDFVAHVRRVRTRLLEQALNS